MSIVLDTLKRVTDGLEFLNETQAPDTQTYWHYKALVKEARATAKVEQPGNNAKMREALESCLDFIIRIDRAFNPFMQGLLENAVAKARAALAAPPRNYGRFDDYHDAVDAWHREERCLGHHQDGGTCEKDPLASTLAPVCFARWLFATAEGEVTEKGDPK